MLPSAIIFAILLILVVLVQVKWANDFVALYSQPKRSPPATSVPHVGVVMSLRGADPFLEDSIRGLLSMDYPSHEVRIIIDSKQDPAFEVVDRIRRELDADHCEIEFLQVCQETSSLKNLALIQGIQNCSPECEVFAWLDSDTVPYKGWLADLIGPLTDDDVGAACGVRWYAPPTTTLANYVRHIWNSGAVLQMVAFNIGWGGAFAIRKNTYQDVGLEDKWKLALVEDTLASNEVLLDGKRVEFVAQCTMPNSESASLKWCVGFVTRQLQGLRYYHSAWRRVLLFGLFSGFVFLANIVMSGWAFIAGDVISGGICTAAILIFGGIASWLMHRSERVVHQFLGDRAVGGFSLPWMLLLAAPLTQLIHMLALFQAYVLSDVTWRGIRYHIRSGLDIKRTNYSPYVAETDVVEHSL